jgi:uncharacterized glyoxalase superfamily protein PhnB
MSSRPDRWPTIVPRFFVDDPAAFAAFLSDVFGASGEVPEDRPAELRIGDSLVMASGTGVRAPMPMCLYVYVGDTDETYRRAMERGSESLEAPLDTPYGDRRATVRDPWGNVWQIATYRARATNV